MKMKHYQIYKITSVISESPEAYAFKALHAVVWIPYYFTLSLCMKLQKHIYRDEWNMF